MKFFAKKLLRVFAVLQLHVIAVLLILLIALSISAAQGISDSLSFGDAISLALNSDNSIAAANANWQSSNERIRSAQAAYWPSLALSGSYSHITNVNEISITIPPPLNIQQNIKTSPDNPFSASLALSWDVYTFGRRSSSVGLARAQSQSSEISLDQAHKIVFDATARSYLTSVFAESNYRLVENEKQRFTQIYNLEQDRYNQQLISEFDLLQMNYRLTQYDKMLLELANVQNSAELNLATWIDMPVSSLPPLTDSLNPELLKLPEQGYLKDVVTSRDEYRQAQASSEMAKLSRSIQKSLYFPSIALFGSYDLRNGYQPDLTKLESNFTAGIKLSWLLFNGFGRRADLASQNYLWRASGYRMADLERKIPPQVQNSRLTMVNKQSRIDISRKALEVARKAMSIARTRYDLGDISMIDLLETENNLAQAEIGLLQAKYDYLLSQLDYKMALAYYPELE